MKPETIDLIIPFQYSKDADNGQAKICKALVLNPPKIGHLVEVKAFIASMDSQQDSEVLQPTMDLIKKVGEVVGDANWDIDDSFLSNMSVADAYEAVRVLSGFIYPPKK